jgi:hypothetical protein
MSITLKEHLKGHREVGRVATLLCAAVLAGIIERIVIAGGHAAAGALLEYAFIALVALAFYQLYRAKKIAKQEYGAAAPEQLNLEGIKRNRLFWFAAIGLVAMYFILPTFLNGEGVDQRLDASQGFDELNYHASLNKAMSHMRKDQIEAYNWAVSDLQLRTFVGRYGKSPTPREVVTGEANAYIKANQEKIVELGKKLAGMRAEVQANADKRTEALRLLKTLVPTVTYMGYSLDTIKKREEKASCVDIVCSKQGNDVYPPHIWYTIENKNNLKLNSLPCTISYHAKGSELTYTQEKECLKDVSQLNNGEYIVQLNPAGNEDFLEGAGTVTFHYEKATITDPSNNWRELNAMPDELPEVQQLAEAKQKIEMAASAKKATNS